MNKNRHSWIEIEKSVLFGGLKGILGLHTQHSDKDEGKGEGEDPQPICGALWIDGTPISGGAGDLALLALVVGAMLFHRRMRASSTKTKPFVKGQ